MDRAPPEILQHIFSFACRDSGHTGRVLSLVSKSIREVSAPVKLQSIAIHGTREISAFAGVLTRTPPPFRRVRYLYIGDASKSSYLPASDRSKEWAREIRRYELYRQHDRICREVQSVVEAIATSLEILELDMGREISRKLEFTRPIHFTNLRDLAISDTGPFTNTASACAMFKPCHTLRRLHVSGGWAPANGMDLMGCISKFAPTLTHLQFSRLSERCHQDHYQHLRHLPAALASTEQDTKKIPRSLRTVIVRNLERPHRNTGWGESTAIRDGAEVASRLRKLGAEDVRFAFWEEEYVERRTASYWRDCVDGGERDWAAGKQAKR